MIRSHLRSPFTLSLLALAVLLLSARCQDDRPDSPAEFTFPENLAITYGQDATVSAKVQWDDISRLELLINDSLVQTWNQPKGELSFDLHSSGFNIGARKITLKSHVADGSTYEDTRLLRILSDLVPERWTYTVEGNQPHNVANFTQGLEFNNGILYESTGQNGASKVAQIDMQTGLDILKKELDATHFGEGMTIMGDTLYQITWQTGRCFLYNKHTLEPLVQDFSYQGEGWGLCNDGKYLIMSDGSERITFRDPKTFTIVRTIEVYTNELPVTSLNELEYIDGLIYANIWMTNNIAVIEPETGRVMAVLDGSPLVSQGRGNIGEVFNGIAYNPQDGLIYLTGKRWQKIFRVRLNKPTA